MAKKDDKGKKKLKETEQLPRKLQNLVYDKYSSSLKIAGVKKAITNNDENFFFSNNDTANKEVNKLLSEMAKQMNYLLLNAIEKEWKQSQETFWKNAESKLAKTEKEREIFNKIRETATQSSRYKTAQSFYTEKREKGLNISDRVWNLAGNAKKEIEIIIQNGIKEGKSADDIQKSLKGYLNEPEKLFRRVRNKETGELEWSKAAQKYKPGQGVYRSAYKNAMRLARTELKAANCEAVWNSAQNNPLITGWKIVLSNNHTTLIDGVPKPFKDICDTLQGIYPKTFKFIGWHPQCRCEMIPILITQKESKKLYKSIFDNKKSEWKPELINKMPENFDKWVEENKQRQSKWSSTPYFVRDNFVNGNLADGLKYVAPNKPIKPVKTEQQKEYMQENLHEVIKLMEDSKVEYHEVKELATKLSESEIVERIAGGDMTNGSCASLAFAYVGNRCGFDVLDFRDGKSRLIFSRSGTLIDIATRVGGTIVEDTNDFTKANILLGQIKHDKEYFFTCGKHAAIVRKNESGGYEYLELQSSKSNGFKELNRSVLKNRFGAQQSHRFHRKAYNTKECIIDIDLLKKDATFRKLLGYINTPADKQQKGYKGTIK